MLSEAEFDTAVCMGSRMEAQANNPIVIDDPESAWLVEAGTVDVFMVQQHNEATAGPRRHVLRATGGQAVFGFETNGNGSSPKLLAVGSPGSRLAKVALKYLREPDATGGPNPTGRVLLEGWITSLCYTVAPVRPPKACMVAEPGKEIKVVSAKSAVCGRQMVWLRHRTGFSHFLGNPNLTPIKEEDFFPLVAQTWVEPSPGSVLECLDMLDFQRMDQHWAALRFFHDMILSTLACKFTEADKREDIRLSSRKAADHRQMRLSLSRLATALTNRPQLDFVGASPDLEPLLAACQIAASTAGIEIRGPASRNRDTAVDDPLREIARTSNVRIRRVLLRGRWWKDDHGPLVGYEQAGKRPVALVFNPKLGYEVQDPTSGSHKAVTPEVSLSLEPFAFTFYRPFPNRKLSARDLLEFGRKNCGKEIATVLLTGTAGGLLGLLTPIFTGMIFDTIIPGARRQELLGLTALLLVSAIGTGMFDVTRSLALLRLEGKMGATLQAAVWDRLLSLPVSFFRHYSAGDLADRANGIDGIRSALTGTVANSIISGIFSLFNLALMFYYSWKLTLVALGLVLIAVGATTLLGKMQLKVMRSLTKVLGQLSGHVFQFVSGISKLRVSGTENRAFGEWAKEYSSQRRLSRHSRELANRFSVFNSVFTVLGPMAIFYSIKEWANPITAGDFLAFNAAFGQLFVASMTMAGSVLQVMGLVPYFERATPILHSAPEVDRAKADPGELTGQIEVSHAAFRYLQDKPLVLQDISFRVEAGQFVAVVGPSGCGKSTLFRLLLGFEDPETGVVSYDSKDLRGLDVQSVRRQMGVVLQNSFPFRGDIFSNIIGSKPLTQDDAWEAARLAGLDEDIKRMPMGMYTVISETGGLSGGQRQRLMIARAIVSKPRILLFDEATSALDNQTQAIVSRSLEGLRATRIVIAHRLSTVINADKIIVFDQGKVVQSGTYAELLHQEGAFAGLAKRQLA